jgi:MurNAc alpha-1-phosphate uridylyltransferase
MFADAPSGAFSLNRLFDRAIEAGRLHGLRLEGVWMHVGSPDAVGAAEAAILASAA